MTLTYDLYFQSQASYGPNSQTRKIKFKGQSVRKIEWKKGRTNGQTDGQTHAGDG